MQPISDKEFDHLFQSRFEDFEMKPSASLWEAIEEKLEGKSAKKKKPFSFFWMAAASVLLFLSAGVWMFKGKEKVYLQGQAQVASSTPVIPKQVTDGVKSNSPDSENLETARAVVKSDRVRERTVFPKDSSADIQQPAEPQIALQPVNREEIKQQDSEIFTPNHPKEKGVIHSTVVAMLAEEETMPEPETKKRRIKSVGDLVNFVVAKVDQREDKIIEMQQDDEGTSISSLNLGLFKIKSKQK